uniref:Uncharacterized protein n=1 Tax=Entomoneis paludosa TaxID=265537 RepID=A0A7S3DXW4_9STRA|mmetsp:Transcript_9931/g.20529  ORF Transcript_9931/g.20529 Transcript_9931/m.20529 type:complete len:270 (+) Transcript_9931:142-951(+)|eukprot:CAMPEP_0172450838 /NCGR_PEP_ID=MMETSP1065-20121228/9052_1 /TAXON_ID=265537 /ORGANISM="Amphiprora paludosa, Strain CCMP125" /LENGTH=269 /DNA_ID=CAMNT_0013202681 /DNA_START=94 /DNA_END=903 /DNA_ORIENTATION=-
MSDDSDIDLDELDAMSSSDEEDDSEDDDKPGMLGSFMAKETKKKNTLSDFDAFADDDEGTVVDKMKTILALRASLGIDDDQSFMAEQERKEQEKKKLEKMSTDERLEYEEGQAGDVMARIRAKHAEKMKQLEAQRQEQAPLEKKKKKKKPKPPLETTDEEGPPVGPDGEVLKKKKKKKKPVDGGDAASAEGGEVVRRRPKKREDGETASADGGEETRRRPKKKERPKGRPRRASTAVDGRPDAMMLMADGVKRKKKPSSKKKAVTTEDI